MRKFGKLTPVEKLYSSRHTKDPEGVWYLKCDCGTLVVRSTRDLSLGKYLACYQCEPTTKVKRQSSWALLVYGETEVMLEGWHQLMLVEGHETRIPYRFYNYVKKYPYDSAFSAAARVLRWENGAPALFESKEDAEKIGRIIGSNVKPRRTFNAYHHAGKVVPDFEHWRKV